MNYAALKAWVHHSRSPLGSLNDPEAWQQANHPEGSHPEGSHPEGSHPEGNRPAGGQVLQPIQEYFISYEDESSPFRSYTHLGTDYGPIRTDEDRPSDLRLSWKLGKGSGYVCVDPALAGTAGVWYSLAGLASDRRQYLDFARCYPQVRHEYQPQCVGMTIDVRGSGLLKLELKSPEERILWWATEDLETGDQWKQLRFSWSPDDLRRVKSLNWVADANAQLHVGPVRLIIEMPEAPFEEKIFLISYAKLARLYAPDDGTVRDRAHIPAGEFDSIPASGLFCLATCAASKMGIVKPAFAERTLRKTHAVVSNLPKPRGLLPNLVRRQGGKLRVCDGADYGTLETSLYYHSMLLAAQMIWDSKTLANLVKAVKKMEFGKLRDSEGYVIKGLKNDGQTPLTSAWRDWGGETALAILLEHMATGGKAKLKMDEPGTGRNGVGYVAELQSLFYPDFSFDETDVITDANWLGARRALLEEQKGYFSRRWPESKAARLGFYGLSAGEGPRGVGYVVNGTRTPGKVELIHPHYVLMSGSLEPDPTVVYKVLATMESCGLIPPWGMVENFTKDLEYLPMHGATTAAFECISAYHLWARATAKRDHIYEAVEYCGLPREAVKAFYPPDRAW
jgi:hypothetical protein